MSSTGYSALFTSGLESSRPRQSLSPAKSYLSLSSESSRSSRNLPSPKPVPSMPLPPSPQASTSAITKSSVRTTQPHLASARADALASLEGRVPHSNSGKPRTRPARRSFMSMSDDEDSDLESAAPAPRTKPAALARRSRANTVTSQQPAPSSSPSPRKQKRSSLFNGLALGHKAVLSSLGVKRRSRGVSDAGAWLANFLDLDMDAADAGHGSFGAARAA